MHDSFTVLVPTYSRYLDFSCSEEKAFNNKLIAFLNSLAVEVERKRWPLKEPRKELSGSSCSIPPKAQTSD